jgi:hypothetical protein
MASRSKMRKIAKYGRLAGLGQPENRKEMETVISALHNPTVRCQLRARLTRGVRQG